MEITGRNVNQTLNDVLWCMRTAGKREDTRNGKVIALQEPLTVCHLSPDQRVLISKARKANPIFHVMEAIWMMAGRKDVKWLAQFNPRMREFADPGKDHLHGAYGWRWKYHYGINQISQVLRVLEDHTTRRAVITMWDPYHDLVPHNDIPCNTHIYFRVHNHRLDMTVCNRSNDLIWGMLGANVVHFSVLQELMAHHLKLGIGLMIQFSNNVHIYERHWQWVEQPFSLDLDNVYTRVTGIPLVVYSMEKWLNCANEFTEADDPTRLSYQEPWFHDVAVPMYKCLTDPKQVWMIADPAWKIAVCNWMETKGGAHGAEAAKS